MNHPKTFDCVQMKDEIQERLSRKWAGLTDEQVRQAVDQELATSDNPLARWWRSLREARRTPVAQSKP